MYWTRFAEGFAAMDITQDDPIFFPPDKVHFSCEETDWLYLTPEDKRLPAQLQHIPSSAVIQVDIDAPQGAEVYPVRMIHARLVHVCDGRYVPSGDMLRDIAYEAMTCWLMDMKILEITDHTPKDYSAEGITDEDIPF